MGKTLICFQQSASDCGVACLVSIARHFGLDCDINDLYTFFGPTSGKGVSLYAINNVARKIGFATRALSLDFNALKEDVQLPCIAHWDNNHFIVVLNISSRYVKIADPAMGIVNYPKKEFLSRWKNENDDTGVVLELKPENLHLDSSGLTKEKREENLMSLFSRHKQAIALIFSLLLLISLVGIIVPVLTRWMFDKGLGDKNFNIVILALAGQFALVAGRNLLTFAQSKISLFAGNRIGVELTRHILEKFARLPRSYFDYKGTGEVLQTIGEASKSERFMTEMIPNTLTSVLSVIISFCILIYYDTWISLVYCATVSAYTLWIFSIMAKKRCAEQKSFEALSRHQNELLQYVGGINEIKISGCRDLLLNRWDKVRHEKYAIERQLNNIRQRQSVGVSLISKLADVVISIIAIKAVINGNMSIGTMMAIMYLIGSLDNPSQQIIYFVQYFQEFKISMTRLNGIYNHLEESNPNTAEFPDHLKDSIRFRNITFRYDPLEEKEILNDVNFDIPAGKTTVIVGASGSGKSSLTKLLLKYYDNYQGDIFIDNCNLKNINTEKWRAGIGYVSQDCFIFNESVLFNITLGDPNMDITRVVNACEYANFSETLRELPLGLGANSGYNGCRLSNGQRQRLLLARMFYKNPELVILDEATNCLDAVNEALIYDNINRKLKGKTVIIVAHRLSTIRHADHIIVLKQGSVVETGSHANLMDLRGHYFNLVSSQEE